MKEQEHDSRAIGYLEGFPTEIIDAMLAEQERQGNPRDVTVLQKHPGSAFLFYCSLEGHDFWFNIIFNKQLDLFFKKHPKNL